MAESRRSGEAGAHAAVVACEGGSSQAGPPSVVVPTERAAAGTDETVHYQQTGEAKQKRCGEEEAAANSQAQAKPCRMKRKFLVHRVRETVGAGLSDNACIG